MPFPDAVSGIPFLDTTTSFVAIMLGFLFLFTVYRYRKGDKKNTWTDSSEIEKLILSIIAGLVIYFVFVILFGGSFIGIQLISSRLGSILYLNSGNSVSSFLLTLSSNQLTQNPNYLIEPAIEIFLLLLFGSFITLLIIRAVKHHFAANIHYDYFYSFLFLIFPFVLTYLMIIGLSLIEKNFGAFHYISAYLSGGSLISLIASLILCFIFLAYYAFFVFGNIYLEEDNLKSKLFVFPKIQFLISNLLLFGFFAIIILPSSINLYNQPTLTNATVVVTGQISNLNGNLLLNSSTPMVEQNQSHSQAFLNVSYNVNFGNGVNFTILPTNATSDLSAIKTGLLPEGTLNSYGSSSLEYNQTPNPAFYYPYTPKYITLSQIKGLQKGKITLTILSNSPNLIKQIFNISASSDNNCELMNCTATLKINNFTIGAATQIWYSVILPKKSIISKISLGNQQCRTNYNQDGSLNDYYCGINKTRDSLYVFYYEPSGTWVVNGNFNSTKSVNINLTLTRFA